MAKKVQRQILKTSASLLGFCFVSIVLISLTNNTINMALAVFISSAALLLTAAVISSIISIRAVDEQREFKIQNIASGFFLSSLAVIFAAVVYITVFV